MNYTMFICILIILLIILPIILLVSTDNKKWRK